MTHESFILELPPSVGAAPPNCPLFPPHHLLLMKPCESYNFLNFCSLSLLRLLFPSREKGLHSVMRKELHNMTHQKWVRLTSPHPLRSTVSHTHTGSCRAKQLSQRMPAPLGILNCTYKGKKETINEPQIPGWNLPLFHDV